MAAKFFVRNYDGAVSRKRVPAKGEVCVFGSHADEAGRVTAFRKNGFYVRVRDSHPTVPGGNQYGHRSVFIRFAD